MPQPIAVTHAVLSLDCGGLERVVVDLIREGRARGHRVDVVCLERPGTLAPEAEQLGAKVVCLNKSPGRSRAAGRVVRAALTELRPDVVHTHQIGVLWHAGREARRVGVPVVVHTEHGNHLKAKSWSRRVRQRALWGVAGRRAARFFCVSEEIAREVTRYGVVVRGKVRVLPNGIDTANFAGSETGSAVRAALGIPPAAPVVGTVGRLSEVKRQDVLIRAFAGLRRGFPDAHLLLVGDGPARAELEALQRGLGLNGVVHLTGYQTRPQEFLRAMDVFALTSRSEGLPLSVLEAWATGLPVVASAVGGLPALIEHGRTGLLFPPADTGALEEALTDLLAAPGLRRRLGDEGRREVCSRYDTCQMADGYEESYRRLLSAR
jgi:glycosyltransferase involved in cell wall biosynthesis